VSIVGRQWYHGVG